MTAKTKLKKRKAAKPAVAAKPLLFSDSTPAKLADFKPVLCIFGDDSFTCFGLTGKERLLRQFARAGLGDTVNAGQATSHKGPVILVRADAVLDQPLIDVMIQRPNMVLTTEKHDGRTAIAANLRGTDAGILLRAWEAGKPLFAPTLLQCAPSELGANYWQKLRKRETPYAFLLTKDNQQEVERRMFMGTYKGATDIITKHLWPVPAFHVTRWLAPRGITPNMVTSVAAVLTLLAFFLFWRGDYVWGLTAAWAMTFLDTVDGKLARTTLSSSKWGDVFDHGIDLVHPPFWYYAWGLGLGAWGIRWSAGFFWWVIGIIIAGYVLQRAVEGIAIKWLGLEIHVWRKVDTLFRQVTARRNPNLILLTLCMIIQRPDWGLIAVSAWTGICFVLHVIQLAQASVARGKTGALSSWMAKP